MPRPTESRPLPPGVALAAPAAEELRQTRAVAVPPPRLRRKRKKRHGAHPDIEIAEAAAVAFTTDIQADITTFPFRAIVCLRTIFKNGDTTRGTGFFVSPTVIATAGHNVPSRITVEEIEVFVDLDGSGTGVSYWTSNFEAGTSFQEGVPESDFGVVVLDEAVGDAVGFFDMQPISDAAIAGQTVDVSGYPIDELRQKAVETQLDGSNSDAGVLAYPGGTVPGQSGSPVYHGDGVALAIHNYDAGAFDVGARLTQSVIDWIRTF